MTVDDRAARPSISVALFAGDNRIFSARLAGGQRFFIGPRIQAANKPAAFPRRAVPSIGDPLK
jgi:hypothetical protein